MDGWREIISLLDRHPSLCVVLASLISVFIAGGFSVFTSIIMRRSEILRLRSDIAVRIGLEAFKQTIEFRKSTPGKIALLPPEFWILSSIKLAELLSAKKMDTETAKIKIQEAIKFSEEIGKIIIEKSSQQPVQPEP